MKSELTYGKNRLNFKHKVQQENAQPIKKLMQDEMKKEYQADNIH